MRRSSLKSWSRSKHRGNGAWSQENETEFITDHLGPLFEKTNTPTRIWILDHNFVYWGRVISQLDDPEVRRYTHSIAWHAYTGEPGMISKVHAAHPEAEMYYTEGSTDYNDPHYQDDWTKWSKTYTDVLNNWCRAGVAWNMATDEKGKPNIGPYPCGGILIINPHTQEIIRSGQYWAFAHFSRLIRRGARRIDSSGTVAKLDHVAFENPDGQKILRIMVDDDGPGLTPAERAKVARRGQRLDESKPGSGLGLSIVVELASLYNGNLTLGSSPIGGLRAELALPAG